MDLNGKKVLVTGGGRGIGREIVLELDRTGAMPLLIGRDEASLEATASELSVPFETRSVDLSDRSEVDELIAWCRSEHPDLSVLVNNAAVQHELDLVGGDADTSMARAREEIVVNLGASVALAVGLLPLLAINERGLIANVTTGLAFAPKEASPVYCATKAGLHAFTQALRYQCERSAPHVRVTEVILPLVDTDMTRGRGTGKVTPEAAAHAIMEGIVSGRAEVWVGKAKLLRVLRRIAPSLPERILRGGGVDRTR